MHHSEIRLAYLTLHKINFKKDCGINVILLPYHSESCILILLLSSNCWLPLIVIPSGSLKVAAGIYGTVCLVRLCSGVNRPPPTQLFVTPFSLGVGWSAKIQRLWNFKQGLNLKQTVKQYCSHVTKSIASQHCRISSVSYAFICCNVQIRK